MYSYCFVLHVCWMIVVCSLYFSDQRSGFSSNSNRVSSCLRYEHTLPHVILLF